MSSTSWTAAGWRPAATDLADLYASKGFNVYMPDYFNGGNSSGWNVDNSTARIRMAVLELRQLYATALIFTTGYCWGGGVGIRVASGPNRVDASAVAHASLVTSSVWNITHRPCLRCDASERRLLQRSGPYLPRLTHLLAPLIDLHDEGGGVQGLPRSGS